MVLLGVILIVVGVGLMILGIRMLCSWLGSTPSRFDPPWFDSSGTTKPDPDFPYVFFIGAIVGPLLGGAVLIVFGLAQFEMG